MPPRRFFLDTSALIKRYKDEIGSGWVNGLFSTENNLYVLNLSILELHKAFHRIRYHPQSSGTGVDHQIDDNTFASLMTRSSQDFLKMNIMLFGTPIIDRTYQILEKAWHSSAIDLSQLAAFLIFREQYPDMCFVAEDESLLNLAKIFATPEVLLRPSQLGNLQPLSSGTRDSVASLLR